jgi:hypothetical protein
MEIIWSNVEVYKAHVKQQKTCLSNKHDYSRVRLTLVSIFSPLAQYVYQKP